MAFIMKCPSCQSALRIKDEYAGKQLKCPRCTHVMAIPRKTSEDEEDEAPPPVAIEAPKRKAPPPRPREEAIEEGEPPPRRAGRKRPRDEDEEDHDRDQRRSNRRDLAYAPCPRCGCTDATRVVWTPWGSFYGPAMFNHVRCRDCGYAYNGRSGRSNLIPAIIFVTIPLLLIIGIIGFLGVIIFGRLSGR